MATEQDLLSARILFKAVLPVMKVILEEDPGFKKKFEGLRAQVQILAKNDPDPVATVLSFSDGTLEVLPGTVEKPHLTLAFPTVAKMNAMFAGKPVIPHIKGWMNVGLLVKFMSLLMAMKLLMPEARPKSPEKARLKVKMTLYMITTALSQLNKSGDVEMHTWTQKQPMRVYQWSCEPEGIAAYLKIKAGKSKAGRGLYGRRKPFVHMKFSGVDAAIQVLSNSVDMVQAISDGVVSVEGPPEYAGNIGTFMVRVAKLVS